MQTFMLGFKLWFLAIRGDGMQLYGTELSPMAGSTPLSTQVSCRDDGVFSGET